MERLNLNNLGVCEMNKREMSNTNGGSIWSDFIDGYCDRCMGKLPDVDLDKQSIAYWVGHGIADGHVRYAMS